MEGKDEALSCFSKGFNCCQSVLWPYRKDFGLDDKTALMVAGAFGGGIAGTGETCGAVTGGLMVIGLRHGMVDPQDQQAKARTNDLAKRFMEEFATACGSVRCKDLLGCDVGTASGKEKALALGLFKSVCPGFVERAVQLLEDMA